MTERTGVLPHFRGCSTKWEPHGSPSIIEGIIQWQTRYISPTAICARSDRHQPGHGSRYGTPAASPASTFAFTISRTLTRHVGGTHEGQLHKSGSQAAAGRIVPGRPWMRPRRRRPSIPVAVALDITAAQDVAASLCARTATTRTATARKTTATTIEERSGFIGWLPRAPEWPISLPSARCIGLPLSDNAERREATAERPGSRSDAHNLASECGCGFNDRRALSRECLKTFVVLRCPWLMYPSHR